MTNGLSYDLIKKAVCGNNFAIAKLIKVYEPYIIRLSTEKLYDKDGRGYVGVNVDVYVDLKAKFLYVIINSSLDFLAKVACSLGREMQIILKQFPTAIR